MTKKEIIELAREADLETIVWLENLLHFAELVAAKERERCAQICEETDNDPHVVLHVGIVCAEAIRSLK